MFYFGYMYMYCIFFDYYRNFIFKIFFFMRKWILVGYMGFEIMICKDDGFKKILFSIVCF